MHFSEAVFIAALISASPSLAVNLITNGSFENGFTGFTHVNSAGLSNPAIVITYGSTASYAGGGAYGEAITPDSAASADPDAVGTHAAYFVDDSANGEALQQLTLLQPGNYEIGFSAYLPQNGFNNAKDATFSGSIIGVTLANFRLSTGTAKTWLNYNGVAQVVTAGYYRTSFDFTSNGAYAKDVVIDQVYVVPTERTASVVLGPPTVAVPEPATWALLLAGFAMVGVAARRRRITVAA